jgi:hypothetical protein
MTTRFPHEDIDHRFNHHPPSPEKIVLHEAVRALARGLAHDWVDSLPEGREKSLALTKLEEAMFWANAAIARG